MLAGVLEQLIPGVRDAKAPLIAGFLWSTVALLHYDPIIPTKDDAAGPMASLFNLQEIVGSPGLLALGVTAVYLVGMLATAVQPLVGRLLLALLRIAWSLVPGRVALQLAYWTRRASFGFRHWRWTRRDARRRRALEAAGEFSGTMEANNLWWDSKQRLVSVPRRFHGLWVKNSPEARAVAYGVFAAVLTPQRASQRAAVVRMEVDRAYRDGMERGLGSEGLEVVERFRDLSGQLEPGDSLYYDAEQDLEGRSWLVVKHLDRDLFDDLDREQAEIDFRVAVLPPVLVIGLQLGGALDVIGIGVAVAAVVAIAEALTRQENLAATAFKLMRVKGLRLPGVDAAGAAGEARAVHLLQSDDRLSGYQDGSRRPMSDG